MTTEEFLNRFADKIGNILVSALENWDLHDFVYWFCFYPNLKTDKWKQLVELKVTDFMRSYSSVFGSESEDMWDSYELVLYDTPIQMAIAYVDKMMEDVASSETLVSEFTDAESFLGSQIKEMCINGHFWPGIGLYDQTLTRLAKRKFDVGTPFHLFFSKAIDFAFFKDYNIDNVIKYNVLEFLGRYQNFFISHVNTSLKRKGVYKYFVEFWESKLADLYGSEGGAEKYFGYMDRLDFISAVVFGSPSANWPKVYDIYIGDLVLDLDPARGIIDRVKGSARLGIVDRVRFEVCRFFDISGGYNVSLSLDVFLLIMYLLREIAKDDELSDGFSKLVDSYLELSRLCAWIEFTKDKKIMIAKPPRYIFRRFNSVWFGRD